MQKKIALSLLSLTLISTYSFASNHIDALLGTLTNDLNKFKKIATQTKQNEHYQPYIISTLKGKTLEKLGITSLVEALELIPGVEIANNNLNFKSPIFRGSNPISFGQSKLLIDGVLVNNIFTDAYVEYLDMPIEMIKRVEVIRGSGSQSDEINAYAGSINVVTYAEDKDHKDLIFAKVGSNSYRAGGFRKGYKEGDFSLFSDFYYQEDDKKLSSGINGMASGAFNRNITTGLLDNTHLATSDSAPLWIKNYSLGLNMIYKEYSLKARINDYEQGAAYGANMVQAQENDFIQLPNHYIELAMHKTFRDIQVTSKVGYKRDGINNHSKTLPNGLILPIQGADHNGSIVFPDGIYMEMDTDQSTLYHSTFFYYDMLENHKITAGYYLSQMKTEDMLTKLTNRETSVGIVDYTDTKPMFDKDAKRDTYTLSLKDQYQYSKKLQILTALNYEKNSHIKGIFNPKLSLVYQKNHDEIYKLGYSKSHRTPSWQELYTIKNFAREGNRDLKAEKVDTYEGAYIRHFSNDSYIQANLYYLINQNQVHFVNKERKFFNSEKDNTLYGAELEYKGNITAKDSLYLNFSYTDGDNSYDESLSNVSHFLAKGYYIYNLLENLSASTIIKYSSQKGRFEMDKRDALDAFTTVDTALVYKNYSYDVDLTLSVKNIFDEEGRYPSLPMGYIDDYTKDGRTFMLTVRKEF